MSRIPSFFVLIAVVLIGIPAARGFDAEDVEGWRADLDLLLTEFPDREGGLTAERREQFMEAVETLKEELPELDEARAMVRTAQAVALAENAHTVVRLGGSGPDVPRLSIRLWWFADGLYVVRARPEHEDLAGKRVVSIGGHAPEAVLEAVGTLAYGNESWTKYRSLYTLIAPKLLYGLGLIESMDSVEFVVSDTDGSLIAAMLEVKPLTGEARREQGWWHLTPATEDEDMEWVGVLDPIADALPLYLKDPNIAFWYEYLPEHRALYLQYNASSRPEGMRVLDVRREVEAFVEEVDARLLIFDLRMNTGGNLLLMRGLFQWIMDIDRFKEPGRLYVITGQATFSAGLFHAANIRQHGGIVVGEPAGDHLDFWAEGTTITLPYSGLTVVACGGFHNYSTTAYPEYDDYLHTKLSIESLEPDIPVALSFEDYRAGRDPVLEAILGGAP